MKIASYKHYAKALTETGRSFGIFKELYADLEDVSQKLEENLEFKQYLSDSHIPFSKKQEMLRKIFQDFISDKTYNFLYLLIKNKKLGYLQQIIQEAQKQYHQEEDIIELKVESVIPLNDEQERQILQIIAKQFNKQALIKNTINPELLGGVKLTVGDLLIDASIKGKLEKLQQKISEL